MLNDQAQAIMAESVRRLKEKVKENVEILIEDGTIQLEALPFPLDPTLEALLEESTLNRLTDRRIAQLARRN